jgi:hypothetical protein
MAQDCFDQDEQFTEFISLKNKSGISAPEYCQTERAQIFQQLMSRFSSSTGCVVEIEATFAELQLSDLEPWMTLWHQTSVTIDPVS